MDYPDVFRDDTDTAASGTEVSHQPESSLLAHDEDSVSAEAAIRFFESLFVPSQRRSQTLEDRI